MSDLKKLGRLIERVEFAMLTTEDGAGRLHSRPMATAEIDGHGFIWFLASEDSPKIREIGERPRVNVSYSSPSDDCYVSISGRAEVVRDVARTRELWSPIDQEWFPKGPDDPRLVLIRVRIESAAYWDRLSTKMVPVSAEPSAA
jgi:general stress protein 26